MAKAPVLTVDGLSIDYVTDRSVPAVEEVSLQIHRGEILGLAGESGCGKSTFAYGINQLIRPPGTISGGSVTFHDSSGEDIDVLALTGRELRGYRWDKVSMVFQGAMNSLNPVIPIHAQLGDVFKTHRPEMSRAQRQARAEELFEFVGVPTNRLRSYAHELSGGMRQRVMIAMALALSPQLIIMDEPTTALDVVVQRDIIEEITRLQRELDFSVLFITHDLPMLLEISDRIAIMKDGRIVELAGVEDIYFAAQHPYTRQLLRSFPSLTGTRGDFIRHGAGNEESGEE
ncbi:ATP-binding cassette domain-containing protein [Streptomyces sp. 3MP-14]|uniref:ATP-binding cassette domain-containing protein n=1 Tax=Streptomyces mimosae TaxID=2586635 RepID=A0A5N6A2T6_9ACTN|nr:MULTISPECIES: ABC transporter ATP-binding protein [Streptomyces]KAB8162289.1 ATP-binding cassette domain-containing protein [Streptomyces mimosae]KAB8173812.1 ATP-binding cassette domain-containing protein [Streptomyces sp. 3MP-14]